MPEASLVAVDVSDLATLVFEVRLPHQRSVSEDPQTSQAGLTGDDIFRLHYGR